MPPIKPLPDYSAKVVAFLKKEGHRIHSDDGVYNLRSPVQEYYVYCYWDGGCNGSYCNKKQVIDTAYDSTTDYDRLYKVCVYSIVEDREVNVKKNLTLE